MNNQKILRKGFVKNTVSGITLIALVITVIVLLILAGISISMLSGDNSILQKATEAKTQTGIGQEKEIITLAYNSAMTKKISDGVSTAITASDLNSELTNQGANANGDDPITVTFNESKNTYTIDSSGNIEKYIEPEPIALTEAKSNSTIFNKKTTVIDNYGNKIIIPNGFKIANDSGNTVKDGIVIEDDNDNQYVWVPVSNINHDGSNKIKIDSTNEDGIEITLGRYTFATSSPGEPTLEEGSFQYASSYATPITIGLYYKELSTYSQLAETNTTAKNLKAFVESVNDNKGYYIARYEASYSANEKAASKVSTQALTSKPATRTAGDLWNYVTQKEAAEACYNLYTTVNSDLINSYAWDTAIVYIQKMGNTNYANAKRR